MSTTALHPGVGGEQTRIGASSRSVVIRRILALLTAAFLACTVIGGTMAAASADDKDDASKYSFYDAASSMASFFSITESPDAKKGINVDNWGNLLGSTGSSGSMLGYLDPKISLSSGWLNSQLSGSSDEIGYDTLHVDNAAGHQGMYNYTQFGAALGSMGLDTTSNGFMLGGIKWVSGGLIMILFLLSGAVDMLFQVVFTVLDFLNPFKLFYNAFYAINPGLAEGMVGGDTGQWGPLAGLVSWISSWYRVLNNMAWFGVIPLFITFFLFSLLFMRQSSKWGSVKKILIRMVYLALGLPLLGSMYSGVLNSMALSGDNSNMGSTKVVLSTYMDFENWAMNNRMALPGGATVEWDQAAHRPTAAAEQNIRNTALAINSMPRAGGAASPFAGLAPINTAASGDSWSNAVMSGADTDTSGSYSGVLDILQKYMNGNQISAATFETNAKGELNTMVRNNTVKAETVQDWFKLFEDEKKLNDEPKMGKAEKAPAVDENPVISIETGTGLNAAGKDNVISFGTNAGTDVSCGSKVADKDGTPANCNMAPLSLYNYLNSDFGPTSMKMYSSSNVMSEATRQIHNSVNLVGTGAMSILYWLNSLTLLVAFVLIGIGYALPLILSNIRRSAQVITAVPLATLGVMSAIAKVIVYTAALILEIMATVFLYRILQEFLTWLPQIVEMPLSRVLNTAGKSGTSAFATFLVGGIGVSLVGTVVSIVFTLMFSIMALRLRGTVIKTLEEGVTKIVEKFLDAPVAAPSTGGGGLARAGKAAGGGLLAGAGAAAGQRMMNRGPGGGRSGTGLRSGGPGGVKSGARNAASKAASGLGGALGITGGSSVTTNGGPGAGGSNGRSGQGELSPAEETALGQQVSSSGGFSGTSSEAARDENGNVLTDAHGNALDEHGNIVTDANGNPVSGAAAAAGLSTDQIARNADGSVATDAQGNVLGTDGTPVTDAQGNPISAEQANQLAVSEAARDAHGNLVTDKDGNVVGKDGAPITDAHGNPISGAAAHQMAVGEPARDENGKLATDKDGNVVGKDGTPLTDANGKPVSADAVQALSTGAAARDEHGNLATDAKGNVVDHKGRPLTDANGAPISSVAAGAAAGLAASQIARNADGTPATDAKGNLVGHDGKPLTNAKGKPISAESKAGRSLAGPAAAAAVGVGAGAAATSKGSGSTGKDPVHRTGGQSGAPRTNAAPGAQRAGTGTRSGTAGARSTERQRTSSTGTNSRTGTMRSKDSPVTAAATGAAAGAALGSAVSATRTKATAPVRAATRGVTGAASAIGGAAGAAGAAGRTPRSTTPRTSKAAAPVVTSPRTTRSAPSKQAAPTRSAGSRPTVVNAPAQGTTRKDAAKPAAGKGRGSDARARAARAEQKARDKRAQDKRLSREMAQANKRAREARKKPRR